MSAFKVFGRSFVVARKRAEKSTEIKFLESFSEWDARVKQRAAEIFDKMKPVAVSLEFDAPQFCDEYIAIAEKNSELFSGLHIRAYQNKVDKNGNPIRNKKTGKIMKAWLPYGAIGN